MKRKIYVILAVLLVSFSIEVNAQHIAYPRFHLGVRGGYTISNASNFSYYHSFFESLDDAKIKSDNSLYGGIAMDFRITHNPLYIETGLYYMSRRFKADIYYREINGEIDYKQQSLKDDLYHIPLLISYHFYVTNDLAIQPFAGGYGGYLHKSERFGYGIRLGCGVNYKRIYANIGYDIGLNEHKFDYYYGKSDHINSLYFTLGFNIVGER